MIYWTILPLFLVALGDLDVSSTVHENVDLIELNHFHDEQGRHVYDQVIFYEYSQSTAQHLVRAWCLLEPSELISRRPTHSHHDDRYHVRWFDPDQNIRRHISSTQYRETWTQTDPERINKRVLDERNRTALYRHAEVAKDKPAMQTLAQLASDTTTQ